MTCLVVAKAPVPGRAKTRLTPPLTPHQGAALAAAALLDTLDAVHAAAIGPVVVALTGELDQVGAAAALRSSLARGRVVPQRGDGFAERLAHAHTDAAGEHGPVLQVGMDTPQLDPAVLREVAGRLTADDGPDAVLGPAVDGGWWCLGLRRAGDACVLREVTMSTGQTGRDTRRALEGIGLHVADASTLRDVDEVGDLAAVADDAPGTRFAELAAALLTDLDPSPHASPDQHHSPDGHLSPDRGGHPNGQVGANPPRPPDAVEGPRR